jgi:hypothetical protein
VKQDEALYSVLEKKDLEGTTINFPIINHGLYESLSSPEYLDQKAGK